MVGKKILLGPWEKWTRANIVSKVAQRVGSRSEAAGNVTRMFGDGITVRICRLWRTILADA